MYVCACVCVCVSDKGRERVGEETKRRNEE